MAHRRTACPRFSPGHAHRINYKCMIAQHRAIVKMNYTIHSNYFSTKYYILRVLPIHQGALYPYFKAIRKSGQLCFPGLPLLAHARRAHGPQLRAELPCSALSYSALRTAPQTCSWYGLRSLQVHDSTDKHDCIGGYVPP